MIKNFAERKKQLQELAPIINLFKSEAVQLRVVELMFQAQSTVGDEPQEETASPPLTMPKTVKRKAAKKRTPTKKAASTSKKAGAKKTSPGTGGMSMLNLLLEEGYFSERHSLNQIIEHCRLSKARKFKANQFSGPLGRLVRDGRLKREKNTDNQYEYWA